MSNIDFNIDSYAALAAAYRFIGDLKRAENFSKSVLILNPKKAAAYNELGIVYKQTGRYKEAEEAFKKGIAAEPDNFTIINNYAMFLFQEQHKIDEAVRILEQNVQRNPDEPDMLQNLATFYHQQGDMKKANQYLRRLRRARSSVSGI